MSWGRNIMCKQTLTSLLVFNKLFFLRKKFVLCILAGSLKLIYFIIESICSIEECLNNDESREFEFTFFQSETVQPGTRFSVQIATTSGLFQSAQMSIDHFEREIKYLKLVTVNFENKMDIDWKLH